MNLNPIAAAIALAYGGLRQYRAPGYSLAQTLRDHPMAATSRLWGAAL